MSTRGPRSAAGKAAVANNHLSHGLVAAAIVLPTESATDWQRFHDDVGARLNAEGPVETSLAARVAELLWRLRRVALAEEQSVSVDQMRRGLRVLDREKTAAVSPVAPDHPAPIATRPGAREALQKHLGIYATGIIANEGAAQFEETLPVLLPDDKRLELIMRYEAHLSRQLNHALHELEALQDRRRGNAAPLTRLDIN